MTIKMITMINTKIPSPGNINAYSRRKNGGQPPPNNFGVGGGGGNKPFAPAPQIIHPHFPSTLHRLCEIIKTRSQKYPLYIYVPFILFEGISKSILFNSTLKFAIISVFNVRYVIFGTDGAPNRLQPPRLGPPPPIF